eukprot:4502315-Amphidinium_carterae.1
MDEFRERERSAVSKRVIGSSAFVDKSSCETSFPACSTCCLPHNDGCARLASEAKPHPPAM